MSQCCPLITCRLTDSCGNPVSPYARNAILYTALLLPEDGGARGQSLMPKSSSIVIEGYVAVFSEEKRISPPIPFCIPESFCILIPQGGTLLFQPAEFRCWAIPRWDRDGSGPKRIRLLIRIETVVLSKKTVSLLVPQVDSRLHEIGRVCISAGRIYDRVPVRSKCCISYENIALRAEISQYNAIADGTRRTFLNSNEIKEYGGRGILSPETVSCCDVFVNALLQPRTNYILKAGELTFTTRDVPIKGAPVIILFTTWKDFDGRTMKVSVWQYSAVSDGEKKRYINEDELKEYGNHGIPSSCEVSYFNLYVNGVLQPEKNYFVKKGVLELTTADAPAKGSYVILESVAVRDLSGQLFHMETCGYYVSSDGGNCYSGRGGTQACGTDRIPNPRASSLQSLFVNGVLQPEVNYLVGRGCLILKTQDSPMVGAPISLRSVSNFCRLPRCKTQMSDAALEQWKRQYSNGEDPCDPAQSEKGQTK